jgi:hypothetical protein
VTGTRSRARSGLAGLVTVSVLLSGGCGSDSPPFDPSQVDLVGTWVFQENTSPVITGTTNDCTVKNVPMVITSDAGTLVVQKQDGGTIQCQAPDGLLQPETPYTDTHTYFMERSGADLSIAYGNTTVVYRGTIQSQNTIGGTVEPDGAGRQGTWSAHR